MAFVNMVVVLTSCVAAGSTLASSTTLRPGLSASWKIRCVPPNQICSVPFFDTCSGLLLLSLSVACLLPFIELHVA